MKSRKKIIIGLFLAMILGLVFYLNIQIIIELFVAFKSSFVSVYIEYVLPFLEEILHRIFHRKTIAEWTISFFMLLTAVHVVAYLYKEGMDEFIGPALSGSIAYFSLFYGGVRILDLFGFVDVFENLGAILGACDVAVGIFFMNRIKGLLGERLMMFMVLVYVIDDVLPAGTSIMLGESYLIEQISFLTFGTLVSIYLRYNERLINKRLLKVFLLVALGILFEVTPLLSSIVFSSVAFIREEILLVDSKEYQVNKNYRTLSNLSFGLFMIVNFYFLFIDLEKGGGNINISWLYIQAAIILLLTKSFIFSLVAWLFNRKLPWYVVVAIGPLVSVPFTMAFVIKGFFELDSQVDIAITLAVIIASILMGILGVFVAKLGDFLSSDKSKRTLEEFCVDFDSTPRELITAISFFALISLGIYFLHP